MSATTTEGTGSGSVEEIRNKIQNSVVREENLFPPEMLMPVGAVTAYISSTAPTGWLNCDGQELYRGDYPALFAVIGTTYGSGGSTTFRLPNLSGRVIVGQGSGSGLTARSMGATGGVEAHVLNINEIPSHSHSSNAVGGTLGLMTADGQNTAGAGLDASAVEPNLFAAPAALSIDSAGSGAAHNNMQPFAVLNYIIKY